MRRSYTTNVLLQWQCTENGFLGEVLNGEESSHVSKEKTLFLQTFFVKVFELFVIKYDMKFVEKGPIKRR